MNPRSRSWYTPFTVALLLASAFASPAVARADRVVVYAALGTVSEERLEHIEEAILAAIRGVGHTVVTPLTGVGSATPTTASEMDGVALSRSADYVLVPRIEATAAGQYRVHFIVGHNGRVEELLADISEAEEEARLRDVLGAMLRPDGLGDDALRLSALETDEERARREAEEARLAAEEAERLRALAAADAEAEAARLAAEEEARRLAEEEERRRAEEEAARAAEEAARLEGERWNARPQYGSDGAWMVLVGGEVGGLVGLSNNVVMRSTGGVFGLVQVRLARLLVEGLELRGGADLILGVMTGLDIQVGAAYQFSPFVDPIYLGASAELGVSFAFTGARDVGFLFRVSGLVGWRPTDHLYLEVALPEIGVMTNGVGALVFGGSLRVGYRFD